MDKNRPVEFIFAIKVYLSLDGKCLGFRRHLRAVYPARFLPVIRGKERLTTRGFSLGKASKIQPRKQPRWLLFRTKSNIEATPVRVSRERERERGALRCTYFAFNYNVTCRREEDTRRCGPTIYRGRHIAEIFSHRIWLVWKDGGGGELPCEIRL